MLDAVSLAIGVGGGIPEAVICGGAAIIFHKGEIKTELICLSTKSFIKYTNLLLQLLMQMHR